MKHVSIFSFIIVTNMYFSSSLPSNMNVKIVFWTIVETANKEWWMNEFKVKKNNEATSKQELII